MERIPNWRYTKEFREGAVKLVTEEGLSVPDASRRLDMPINDIKLDQIIPSRKSWRDR